MADGFSGLLELSGVTLGNATGEAPAEEPDYVVPWHRPHKHIKRADVLLPVMALIALLVSKWQ